jgi:hypothetical protein
MKTLKWTLLVMSGGLLVALGSCATDLLYFVMQGVATQIASAAVGGAVGA